MRRKGESQSKASSESGLSEVDDVEESRNELRKVLDDGPSAVSRRIVIELVLLLVAVVVFEMIVHNTFS